MTAKNQNLNFFWSSESNFVFPDIPSRNVTVEDNQKFQPQHKKIPRVVEFYNEQGSPVIYRIRQNDNLNDTCNDFYLNHFQQRNNNEVLQLHNDGANFMLNSLSSEFPIATTTRYSQS